MEHLDVAAERGGHVLRAEAEGATSSTGLDTDTMYGQVLRRMQEAADPRIRYAVVVPERALSAVLRVPSWVRAQLHLDVYTVGDDRRVLLKDTSDPAA